MTNKSNPLERIVFLSIPGDLEKSFGDFTLDPAILIPVELPLDSTTIDADSLSWEMIISGMLKVLSHDHGHKDADYFRSFVLAVRPEIERDLTQAAIAKAELHEYELAEELFQAMTALMPEKARHKLNHALVMEQRASNFRNLGQAELALTWEERAAKAYRKTLGMDDCPPEAWLYAGHFHLRLNDVDRALDLFSNFIELAPEHEEAEKVKKIIQELSLHNLDDTHFKEAFDFIRLGQEEKALESINSFLERHGEVWNAHFLKGWALRRLGRYPEGVTSFKEALSLGGGNPDTLNELSICLMETGDFDAAGRALDEALKLEPENTKIMSNLGILYLKKNMIKEALGFFNAVLVYEPEDPIAKQYIEHIQKQS